MGLPKPYRLRQRRDFHKVYQSGLRRTGEYVILRALFDSASDKDTNPVPSCIGISISQKVDKKAVIRNRIKRQIRVAMRTLLPRIPPGWKMVIVVRPSCSPQCNYAKLLIELEQLLLQAEVIHGY